MPIGEKVTLQQINHLLPNIKISGTSGTKNIKKILQKEKFMEN